MGRQADPNTGLYFPPGAQTPQAYPVRPGPNYSIYGQQTQNGYIYDPYTDKYKLDPKAVQQYYENSGLVEKPKEPAGFADIALPIAGASALVAGGKYLGENIGSIGSGIKDTAAGLLGSGPSAPTTTVTQATQAGASALPSALPAGVTALGDGTLSVAAGSAVPEGFVAAGTMADGSTMVIPGAEAGLLGSAAPYLGAAGAALGAYGIYNATEMNNKSDAAKMGAVSGAGMGAGLAMAAPLVGMGPVGWAGLGAMALGGAVLGGGLGGFSAHESTKEAQERRWGSLAGKSEDPNWQQGVNTLMAANHPDGDDGIIKKGPLAGQKWNWEKVKQVMTPEDMWGTYAVLSTFGPDWLNKYSEEQRRSITQALIDADMFDSKKGDIIMKDMDKAKQIASQVTSGAAPTAAPAQPPAPAPQAPAQPAPQPAPQNFAPETRIPLAPENGAQQQSPGLLGSGPNTRSMPMPMQQAPAPQTNRPLPLPVSQAPKVNLPLLMPEGKAPAQPPGLLGSNAQPLAPAPQVPPGAPPPQPVARPIMQPQNQVSSFNPSNGYDRDRDGPWVSFSQPGLLSVRS